MKEAQREEAMQEPKCCFAFLDKRRHELLLGLGSCGHGGIPEGAGRGGHFGCPDCG